MAKLKPEKEVVEETKLKLRVEEVVEIEVEEIETDETDQG